MAGRPRELVHGDLRLADLEAGDGEAGRGQGAVPHTQVQHPGTGDMLPSTTTDKCSEQISEPGLLQKLEARQTSADHSPWP